MEELVKGLIDFQKEFQRKFLTMLEKQNSLIEHQNVVLEKLLEKYDDPNSSKRSVYETEFLEDTECSPAKIKKQKLDTDEEEDLFGNETVLLEEFADEFEDDDETSTRDVLRIKREPTQNETSEQHKEDLYSIIFPINDINVLFEMEEECVANPEFEAYLEKIFREATPTDEIRFSNCGLNKLLTDQVIGMMNWNGEQGKLRMSGMKIFKTVLKRSWSSLYRNEADFLRLMKLHLKAAKRRIHTQNSRKRNQVLKKVTRL